MLNLNVKNVERYTIPLPSIHEQQEIIDFLDKKIAKIDSLKEKQKHIIEELSEYRTTLISDVVTGKVDVRDEAIP